MSATAKKRKRPFNQSQFRKEVDKYYGAAEIDGGYCPLTGRWPSRDVNAAHLVPKSMASDELCDLFGVGELVLSNPRNGKIFCVYAIMDLPVLTIGQHYFCIELLKKALTQARMS